MNFRLVVEQAALDFLLVLRGAERTALVRFLNQLCKAPDTRGDLRFQDETMRWVERKVSGRLRVTDWPDYAVRNYGWLTLPASIDLRQIVVRLNAVL